MFSHRRAVRRSAAEEERDVTNEQILEKYGLDMNLVETPGEGGRRRYPKELQDEIIKLSHQVEDVSVFAKEIGIPVGNIWQWRRKLADKTYRSSKSSSSNGEANGAVHSSEGLPLIATTKRPYTRRTTASNGTSATFECATVKDAVAILTKFANVSGRVSITIH